VAHEGRRLILVRHSLPEFVTGMPASQWHLSAEGRRRCRQLAERLAAHDLAVIVTSKEPKAIETGQILAEMLGVGLQVASGLHEQERRVVTDMGRQEQFRAQVVRFFERPDELVMGYETAEQAHTRFHAAVAGVVEQHPTTNLAIVSHGTVITLLIAHANHLDPVLLWQSLGLPAFAALSLPDLRLLNLAENV
jgi:broad specificity phosphatase PhoE